MRAINSRSAAGETNPAAERKPSGGTDPSAKSASCSANPATFQQSGGGLDIGTSGSKGRDSSPPKRRNACAARRLRSANPEHRHFTRLSQATLSEAETADARLDSEDEPAAGPRREQL